MPQMGRYTIATTSKASRDSGGFPCLPIAMKPLSAVRTANLKILLMSLKPEIVAGSAPGWADPWSRAQRVFVQQGEAGWPLWLVDAGGYAINKEEVQLARLAAADQPVIEARRSGI